MKMSAPQQQTTSISMQKHNVVIDLFTHAVPNYSNSNNKIETKCCENNCHSKFIPFSRNGSCGGQQQQHQPHRQQTVAEQRSTGAMRLAQMRAQQLLK